jgi:hypothetical protein
LDGEEPWQAPRSHRIRVNIDGIEPRRVGAPKDGSSTPMMTVEHLDLRYAPSLRRETAGLQTIRSLLATKSPPTDEREEEQGLHRLGAHDGNILIRDCTVDADLPVALDNASLFLVDSYVRGYGHISWAEIAVRRAAIGVTRTALLSMFGGPLIVSATARARPSKVDEEVAATRAVAQTLNMRRGARYTAERPVRDGKYEPWEDGILRSSGREVIPVQVRHFSDDLARLLRGPTRSARNHDVGVLSKVLQSAIDDKTDVDPNQRRNACLVLISPVALGAIKRTEIAALQLRGGGYADVWLYPLGEQAYSLIGG